MEHKEKVTQKKVKETLDFMDDLMSDTEADKGSEWLIEMIVEGMKDVVIKADPDTPIDQEPNAAHSLAMSWYQQNIAALEDMLRNSRIGKEDYLRLWKVLDRHRPFF